MTLGIVGFSLAFLVWGLVPGSWFWVAVVSGALIGLTIPLIDGPLMAILQSTVAPDIQGRVFTLFGSLILITSPLGLSMAGPISDWLGLQVWYLVAGSVGYRCRVGLPPGSRSAQHRSERQRGRASGSRASRAGARRGGGCHIAGHTLCGLRIRFERQS